MLSMMLLSEFRHPLRSQTGLYKTLDVLLPEKDALAELDALDVVPGQEREQRGARHPEHGLGFEEGQQGGHLIPRYISSRSIPVIFFSLSAVSIPSRRFPRRHMESIASDICNCLATAAWVIPCSLMNFAKLNILLLIYVNLNQMSSKIFNYFQLVKLLFMLDLALTTSEQRKIIFTQ